MRKGPEAQRFPNSALLFRFCLRVLEVRQRGVKVHDQEVGNILLYNPSDTSHWKRGKKSVRSMYALEALSQKLDVDLETIQDLSDGTIELEEAWFDFTENEDERRLTKELTSDLIKERRDRQLVFENVAAAILEKANVKSVPIYLPEVLSTLPFIQVVQGDLSEKLVRTSRVKPGQYSIRYRKGELRAHTRAAIAREIARVVLYSERENFNIPPRIDSLAYFEMVDLSNALLVPKSILQNEIIKSSAKVNMVKSLSDVFWVPKSVIRGRLTDVLLSNASNQVFDAEPLVQKFTGIIPRPSMADLSDEDVDLPLIAAAQPTYADLASQD